MGFVVLVVIVGLLFWFFSTGSKLRGFRSRTLAIVRQSLGYDPAIPGMQQPVFEGITREILAQGGNEYDAAIAFVLVQCAALSRPLDPKAKAFVDDKIERIGRVIEHSPLGNKLMMEYWNQEFAVRR